MSYGKALIVAQSVNTMIDSKDFDVTDMASALKTVVRKGGNDMSWGETQYIVNNVQDQIENNNLKLYNKFAEVGFTPTSHSSDDLVGAVEKLNDENVKVENENTSLQSQVNSLTTQLNSSKNCNANPAIIRIYTWCNQPYGTYDWEGGVIITDAISNSQLFSGLSGSFSWQGNTYTVSAGGDTVYGEYSPWIKATVYDGTNAVTLMNNTSGTYVYYFDAIGRSYKRVNI